MAYMPKKEAEFLIHHLFLPPQLPRGDDHDPALEKALLTLVHDTLGRFAGLVPPGLTASVKRVQQSIHGLAQSLDSAGGLDDQQLLQQLLAMGHSSSNGRTDAVLPVYVAAQNACLLVSQEAGAGSDEGHVLVEAFELAPRNKDVMATHGRLCRTFPGPALRIPQSRFADPALLHTLARTLGRMSMQAVHSMRTMVTKADSTMQEVCDTTDPALVTELLFAFLSPLSLDRDRDTAARVAIERIQKHTREDIRWDHARRPWHRSPLWLLVRVVLHLGFWRARPAAGISSSSSSSSSSGGMLRFHDSLDDGGYKLFMVFLLSTVLDRVLPLQLPMDTYYVMSAKIGRRLTKMRPAGTEAALAFVQCVLRDANDELEKRWAAVQREEYASFSLNSLPGLRFGQDVFLTLPDLDRFLDALRNRERHQGARANACVMEPPKPFLLSFPAAVLPQFHASAEAPSPAYNLQGLERWVAEHLGAWTENHTKSSSPCASLGRLMRSYHKASDTAYRGNPEARSLMLLTLLELWIALDRSAVGQFALLADYDPGVEPRVFEQLVLPRHEDMLRLHRAEVYLQTRRMRASKGTPGSIFRDFGTHSCFAVRYVTRSSKLKKLQEDITREAIEARREKVVELAQSRAAYDDLVRQQDELECTYQYKRNRADNLTRQHDRKCERCRFKRKARGMTIEVHEWPLPKDVYHAQAVVFELAAPPEFVCWRQATLQFLIEILGGRYKTKNFMARGTVSAQQRLDQYDALSKYRKGGGKKRGNDTDTQTQRDAVWSSTKPHMATHRRHLKVSSAADEADVCLDNGLKLQYFDTVSYCFTDAVVLDGNAVGKLCTYQLPARSAALAPFLRRPFGMGGHGSEAETAGQVDAPAADATANKVIAHQAECPPHLALAEFQALAGLLVGNRLPWLNILVQLAAPAIDFTKVEATVMVMQGIFQGGPAMETETKTKTKTETAVEAAAAKASFREAHSSFADPRFAPAVLAAVRQAAMRIEQNWASLNALHMLILVVQRVLSFLLSSVEGASSSAEALALLASLRQTAFGWAVLLEEKFHRTADAAQKRFFSQRAVDTALACVATLDVDDMLLPAIVADRRNAALLVRCAMLIHDQDRLSEPNAGAVGADEAPHLGAIVRWRWQRLAQRVYPFLRDQITSGTPRKTDGLAEETCLNEIVRDVWPNYRPGGGGWRVLSAELDYWVMTETAVTGTVVHYCLLTGKLLVNGLPLSRLPATYEEDRVYRTLFGDTVFQIFPSVVSGLQFTARESFAGHTLHLGRGNGGSDGADELMVRADKHGSGSGPWHLVPSRVFEGRLPHSLVADCVHWLDETTGTVAFRPQSVPWADTASTWFLRKTGSSDSKDGSAAATTTWQLTKDRATLVGPESPTGSTLAALLTPLQPAEHVQVVLDRTASQGGVATVEIILPRLHMTFHLRQGTTAVRSRQCTGFSVDASQELGTLVGLRSKLVLRREGDEDDGDGDRVVLVPPGPVSVSRDGDHVSVAVDTTSTSGDSSSSVHMFRTNDVLGKLDPNSSLRGALTLAHLHALTAACLPDPFTHRTGTEQALALLRSAAVASSGPLATSEIAQLTVLLDDLTPKVDFYPPHGTRVMQTVRWNARLGPLAQHPSFYDVVVALFEQHKRTQLYFSKGGFAEPPDVRRSFPVPALLRRLAGRTAAFRTAGFGAEDTGTDADTDGDAVYTARDVGQASNRCTRARAAASMLVDGQLYVAPTNDKTADLAKTIWNTFRQHGTVHGPSVSPEGELAYDGRWLHDHHAHWAQLWCWLHRQAQAQAEGWCDDKTQLQLRIWLTTMAFADAAEMDMMRAMAFVLMAPSLPKTEDDDQPLSSVSPDEMDFPVSKGRDVDRTVLHELVSDHLHPLDACPESKLPPATDEDKNDTEKRQQETHDQNQSEAVAAFVDHLCHQWPCVVPQLPTGPALAQAETYIDVVPAANSVRTAFQAWSRNRSFFLYLEAFAAAFHRLPVLELAPGSSLETRTVLPAYARPKASIEPKDLFVDQPPRAARLPNVPRLYLPADALACRSNGGATDVPHPQLEELVDRLSRAAGSDYEKDYAQDLNASLGRLQEETGAHRGHNGNLVVANREALQRSLVAHRVACTAHVQILFAQIRDRMHAGLDPVDATRLRQHQGLRLSSAFLIEQLARTRREQLPDAWRLWIVAFGVALTAMQRARRLVRAAARSQHDQHDLLRELQNEGHANWDPHDQPDTLIMEIEGNLLVRPVQARIAQQMREPAGLHNTVLQLNMGEGKSSVIAPMVVAALANGKRLVRVVVAKPQSQQMHRMLMARLGGVVNRRIFHLPFSRSLRLTASDTAMIHAECMRCMAEGGVLLVQPEHLLSLQLMGIERIAHGDDRVGAGLLRTQHLFATVGRDVVDESDENFGVAFELVYTVGVQRPVAFAPDRWVAIQAVLDVVGAHAAAVHAAHPQFVEVEEPCPAGRFPRLRVYGAEAMHELLQRTARDICTIGLPGLSAVRQGPAARDAVFRYITEPRPQPADVTAVENGPFWETPIARSHVLLLRGLFACGILAFVFGQKRWRVHYGTDAVRQPPTQLAVPFRAKDSPSLRSEFSHPDVLIALTCTSHCYQGLADADLFLAFGHLVESDQADAEYHAWVQGAEGLAPAFRSLIGVNLKDRAQCVSDVFPAFRYTKRTIDYFLHTVVFARQLRAFPQKLSASGWDLGAVKAHPTTGFSGTVDARRVLPLDVRYADLPEQKHTNALVLDNLLRPENGVLFLPAGTGGGDKPSVAETLVRLVVDQGDARLRVVLDVGAQVLEWTNEQVAAAWLQMERERAASLVAAEAEQSGPASTPVEAAVYFNDCEELVVLDHRGRTESLHTSPYADQLDACIVFLDEAHTRGTDLRLPRDYRAAVTLGANLTKDRLAQACMRMRGLGRGQSVVFCIPEEIHLKIRQNMATTAPIRVLDVLDWAIRETHSDLRKSLPLWAVQGQRFERQRLLWDAISDNAGIHMTAAQASAFLEDEDQSLETLYLPSRPGAGSAATAVYPEPVATTKDSVMTDMATGPEAGHKEPRFAQILARCHEVADIDVADAALHEEQERELAPEFEQERQVQRPAPARPAVHRLHPDLVRCVRTGAPLPLKSSAILPAFESLRTTSASQQLDGVDIVAMFPSNLLVTTDFAATVHVPPSQAGSFVSDAYQRPVQWLLANHGNGEQHWTQLIVISPFEANALLPIVRSCQCSVGGPARTTMHLYAPRPSLAVASLERLGLYTVQPKASTLCALPPPPQRLRTLLNLFAGQLYLNGPAAYRDLCALLRLADQPACAGGRAARTEVATDGFLLDGPAERLRASPFHQSPVPFLKVFLTRVRKDGQAVDKTHLGRMLDGQLLVDSDLGGGMSVQ